MGDYIDQSDLDNMDMCQDIVYDYPTPTESSDAGLTVDTNTQRQKKKRKAWGQPVPEIVPILPPRKRAKTSEEKEQRKNERILRNRRAADKSRQRQKAAQAELEQLNKDLIAENAQLKILLSQHGLLSDFKFTATTPAPSISVMTPSVIAQEDQPVLDDDPHQMPHLSLDSPSLPPLSASSTLVPTLDADLNGDAPSFPSSGLTQYPAAILCDLQCQPEVLVTKLKHSPRTSSMLFTVLTYLHYLTIAKTCSSSMRSHMAHLFRFLEETLMSTPMTLLEALLTSSNFQLIHILISMPSTPTQPPVFRLKLLSRLLACNPSLAPLLKSAADRALLQKLEDELWTADADCRWAVASLMTLKWSIKWLEHEHSNLRLQFRCGRKVDKDWVKAGIDAGAVERNYSLFDKTDPMLTIEVVPAVPQQIQTVVVH